MAEAEPGPTQAKGLTAQRASENFKGHNPKPVKAALWRDGLFVIFCRQYELRYYRPQSKKHDYFYTFTA